MAVSSKTDKFANIAHLKVVESALNTLTFAKLELANNLLSEKAAIIIHRAEMQTNAQSFMNASGDYWNCAVTVSNAVTDISDLSQPEILFSWTMERLDLGAAASGMIQVSPWARDFTQLPGLGIIVPADRLYIGAAGNGLTTATTTKIRIYYTVMPLAVNDYWELIEARRVMTT